MKKFVSWKNGLETEMQEEETEMAKAIELVRVRFGMRGLHRWALYEVLVLLRVFVLDCHRCTQKPSGGLLNPWEILSKGK